MKKPTTCYFYRNGYCDHKHDTGCGFYVSQSRCTLDVKATSLDALGNDRESRPKGKNRKYAFLYQ